MNKIITIGREFGSGGREFGRRLAEQLGYAYYDQEIIREIASRTALSEKYVQQIVEHRPVTSFPIHTGRSFMMMYDPLMEQNQSIFRGQCEILQQMAEKSDCVIVGRCADYILRDRNPLRDLYLCRDVQQAAALPDEGPRDPDGQGTAPADPAGR